MVNKVAVRELVIKNTEQRSSAYSEPAPDLRFKDFARSLVAHASSFAATRGDR